jgi:hypothetical protein
MTRLKPHSQLLLPLFATGPSDLDLLGGAGSGRRKRLIFPS